MEAAFPGTEQESHEDWEGEHTLTGEVLGVDAMGGDKVRVVQRGGKAGQDIGMYIAKFFS